MGPHALPDQTSSRSRRDLHVLHCTSTDHPPALQTYSHRRPASAAILLTRPSIVCGLRRQLLVLPPAFSPLLSRCSRTPVLLTEPPFVPALRPHCHLILMEHTVRLFGRRGAPICHASMLYKPHARELAPSRGGGGPATPLGPRWSRGRRALAAALPHSPPLSLFPPP